MKFDHKINLGPKDEETFEFEYDEEYDMFTFVYGSKDEDSEDPIEIKTELGGIETKAIMEATIFHIMSAEGMSAEDFVDRYLLRNKFRGNYEQ